MDTGRRQFLTHGAAVVGGVLLGASLSGPITRALENGQSFFRALGGTKELERPADLPKTLATFSDLEKGYHGANIPHGLVKEPAKPNVILVVIDTLRADHVGCYGANPFGLFDKRPEGNKQYQQGASPAIDVFAGESARFDRAYSITSKTNPAIASLLTALPLTTHGVLTQVGGLDPKTRTLAEILKEAGYRTGAVYSTFTLDDGKPGTSEHFRSGLSRGFDFYHRETRLVARYGEDDYVDEEGRLIKSRAKQSVNAFLQWVDGARKSQPFFGLVHLFDPHDLYDPLPPFDLMFGKSCEDARTPILRDSGYVRGIMGHMSHGISGGSPLSRAGLKSIESLYYGEIAYTSAVLSILFNRLNEWGLSDNTAVILTADHGESMTEHGLFFTHVWVLYQDNTRIPLVVRCPWLVEARGGLVVDALASSLDVMPTILDICKVEVPRGLFGASLVPLLKGEKKRVHDCVFSEGPQVDNSSESEPPVRAVLSEDGFHYIAAGKFTRLSRTRPTLHNGEELYNLKRDCVETVNLARALPEKKAELKKALEGFVGQAVDARKNAGVDQKRVELSRGQMEALRSLGYLR